ncbi:hypothetical protein PR048_010005 [Dryococelus australis]|uniref:Uncharacterized protein n=1 Tax=Dryococelus australis TaxID=614101 RepID=A0ABQ9I287_9NEOP|nr:hypothetical protein PR048_010005 [Dryococelus australis]
MRCEYLLREPDVSPATLEMFAESAYPVLHAAAVPLYFDFLEYKTHFGSQEEKVLYADMTVTELVDRLLKKRAATFSGPSDYFLLVDGRQGRGGWDDIGKTNSRSSLRLIDCLSYDELKLSALLSVSSYSYFINNGNRNNNGVPDRNMQGLHRAGVVIGLTGTRFERPNKMDWEEIIITKEQNVLNKGYGSPRAVNTSEYYWRQLWCQFYGLGRYLPTYRETETIFNSRSTNHYLKLSNIDGYFHNIAFSRRLAVSFETLLMEAQHRAYIAGRFAYIHVVGIGLGVWKISDHQETVFLNSFANCITRLIPILNNVSDINFSWFRENTCGGVPNGGNFRSRDHPRGGIQIFFSKRNPHDRILDPHQNKLLVVSYAWNSNALPGNSFWKGALSGSADPAQACSSQITELHNPHINDLQVCGDNLHIATSRGVVHVSQLMAQ